MKILQTPIDGLFILENNIAYDQRGLFFKPYTVDIATEHNLEADWKEIYYSVSGAGVIRGLHFQLPPKQHAKLVFTPQGKILDAVVDLRPASQTFGTRHTLPLSAECGRALYIPAGCAHGFRALEEGSLVCYATTSPYSPEHDSGIRWDSAGIDWGISTPVVSERDASLPSMDEFLRRRTDW